MVKRIFLFIFVLILILSGLGAWLLLSSSALEKITPVFLIKYVDPRDMSIAKTEGNLLRGAKFKDIKINKVKGINPEISAEIQEVKFSFPNLKMEGITLKVTNGRLELSKESPVIFQGGYQNQTLDFNIYANTIDLKRLSALFPNISVFRDIRGIAVNPDIYLKGPWLDKKITGEFMVKDGFYKEFKLTGCFVTANCALKKINNKLSLIGNIDLKQGVLTIRKTNIQIEGGRIILTENLKDSIFDLKGFSLIEGIRINIVFKGTLYKPDLRLTSDPPLPKDTLLLMLATGRRWQDLKSSNSTGELNINVVKDFIDYFVLGGSASNFAKSLGISDISLTYTTESKSIKATSPISDKIGVTYGVEQKQPQGKPAATQYDVGAQLKVTDTVSVEAERKIKPQSGQTPGGGQQQPDDTILLKYKKEF